MRSAITYLLLLLCALPLVAERKAKVHVVSYGKVMTVRLMLGADEKNAQPVKVRPLYIDGKLKEFVTGEERAITDHLAVARRIIRINNNLPEEKVVGNWLWRLDGWLLVDRAKAQVKLLTLPFFDPYYSQTSWFRDYAAYCGFNDSGEKLFAVVTQIGARKPVLKAPLGAATHGEDPADNCQPPQWEKSPVRVSFAPTHGEKKSFQIFERTVSEAETKPATSDDAAASADKTDGK